jgi:hypothetical protein
MEPVVPYGLGRKGEGAASLGIDAGGAPFVLLSDQNGKHRIVLSLGKDNAPFLAFSDTSSIPRVFLSASESGALGVQLLDKNKTTRSR